MLISVVVYDIANIFVNHFFPSIVFSQKIIYLTVEIKPFPYPSPFVYLSKYTILKVAIILVGFDYKTGSKILIARYQLQHSL